MIELFPPPVSPKRITLGIGSCILPRILDISRVTLLYRIQFRTQIVRDKSCSNVPEVLRKYGTLAGSKGLKAVVSLVTSRFCHAAAVVINALSLGQRNRMPWLNVTRCNCI